jgi:hypothetical protein
LGTHPQGGLGLDAGPPKGGSPCNRNLPRGIETHSQISARRSGGGPPERMPGEGSTKGPIHVGFSIFNGSCAKGVVRQFSPSTQEREPPSLLIMQIRPVGGSPRPGWNLTARDRRNPPGPQPPGGFCRPESRLVPGTPGRSFDRAGYFPIVTNAKPRRRCVGSAGGCLAGLEEGGSRVPAIAKPVCR